MNKLLKIKSLLIIIFILSIFTLNAYDKSNYSIFRYYSAVFYNLKGDAFSTFDGGLNWNKLSDDEKQSYDNSLTKKIDNEFKVTVSENVYPNPSNSILNVDISTSKRNIKYITIYNMLGNKKQTIENFEPNTSNQMLSIDISGLSLGTYILLIETDTQNETHLFIKE